MIDEFSLEIFCRYYKRLMWVEAILKNLLITQYLDLYNKNNVYKITFAQFFSKTEKNKHNSDSIYTKLERSNKSEEEKFTIAIEKMYLSEVINFLGHPVFLKSKIRKTFFKVETNTKTTTFQSNAKNLNLFRNAIAHIDVKKFNKDKNRFLDALNFFENILGINHFISPDFLSKIEQNPKLSTMDILKLIYKINPSIFDNDKILLLLFDEITFMNGYTFETLPQRWTIIRQKFRLENYKKTTNSAEAKFSNQMKLDF